MKASSLYASFISAEDIHELTTVTIAGVTVGEFTKEGQGMRRKIVIEFEDFPGRLAVNKTNAEALIAKFGDDTDDWIGKTVVLGVENVKYMGKKTLGVRIQE